MGNWIKTYQCGVIKAIHEFSVDHCWDLIYFRFYLLAVQDFSLRSIEENNGYNA